MSKGASDVFALFIIFLGFHCKQIHVTLVYLKTFETTWHALEKKLTNLSNEYGLRNKIITNVKNEGSNLNIMINAPKFIVKFEALSLKESF
jgi:hypothetical protein